MEYLTVKEFSEKAAISKAAVYQQLNGRLKPYVMLVNGKKKISSEALEVFYSNSSNVNISNISENIRIDELQILKDTLEILEKELDRKDAALQAERQRVDDLNNKLAAAYQQISEMGKASQYITAADKTIELIEKQPATPEQESPAASQEQEDEQESPAAEKLISEPNERATREKNWILKKFISWFK